MRFAGLAFALGLGLAAACGGKSKDTTTTPPAPAADTTTASLYTRLGEKPAIEAVIDKFLANVVADARINARFSHMDEAAVIKLRNHLVDQVCAATGGPCQYTGKDMVTVHTKMNVTDAEFDALVEDLVAALDELGVQPTEKGEVLGALGGMRGDIVGR
ncbi:MAG TPA: group 1 truncated hemoglobin [Kofleriaceae bacterium]|nr:group 1 truncated hemoglobin [Kofleriaceae bacterium]